MVLKEISQSDITSKDHLLIASVWPEPTQWINNVKKEHPGIRVTYYQITMGRWEVYHKGGSTVPIELFKDVTIFGTMVYLPSPTDAPNLQLISVLSAGVDHIRKTPIWTDTDIAITSCNGVHGPQIAEWVIGHILSHNHHFRLLEKWQTEHYWGSFSKIHVKDLVTQKLAVLGYGSIGRQCARVAAALGVEVHAYTAGPKNTPESRRDNGYIVPGLGDPEGTIPVKWYSGLDKKSLHEFLAVGFDFILLSLPLTDDTKGMFGEEEFKILKDTKTNPFLINIGRGQIVKTDELVKALKWPQEEGGLRGAALDVVDPEPLPSDSELWDIPNLYISPHISGAGDAYFERCLEIIAMNLRLRAEGKPLINHVDRKRGY